MLNIFLSYCRRNTDIADVIDNDFKAVGISLQRDVRDLPYRSSIKEFMNRIGKMEFVLMILSDEYLRSEWCMYEVTELLNTHEFEKRILPVMHGNATAVFNNVARVVYYDYWKSEIAAAKKRLKQHPNADHIDQVKRCTSIYEHLDIFFTQLTDLNVHSFSSLKEQQYKPMLDIIGTDKSKIIEEILLIHSVEDKEEKELQLEEFMEKYPGNKHGLLLRAYIEKEQELYTKAKKHYEELIVKFPQNAAAHYNLAILLNDHFQDYEGAKRHYITALEINPQDAEAHNNLAILLADHFQNYEEAKAHYIIAVEINTQYAAAHNNLANLLAGHFQDYEDAKAHYLTALEINPQHAKAYYNLANLLDTHFADKEAAKKYYLTATSINPEIIDSETDDYFDIKR